MNKRTGFSLIELLVVMFAIGVIMLLLTNILLAILKTEYAAIEAFDHMHKEAELADLFRGEVAQATGVPEFDQDFKASPLCMLLKKEDGVLVVLRGADGMLERVTLDRAKRDVREFPLESEETRVEFERQGRLLSMTLRHPNRPPLVIRAALGAGP